MKFDEDKFNQDEYVFRIRALLEQSPGSLDLSGLEENVRKTPDQHGKLPIVTEATLRTRLERALLWLMVHEGAELVGGNGGGDLPRIRLAASAQGGIGEDNLPEEGLSSAAANEIMDWKEKHNDRRLTLLGRKYDGSINEDERAELDRLQAQIKRFQLRRRGLPESSLGNDVG
jgi:hypothetical protein